MNIEDIVTAAIGGLSDKLAVEVMQKVSGGLELKMAAVIERVIRSKSAQAGIKSRMLSSARAELLGNVKQDASDVGHEVLKEVIHAGRDVLSTIKGRIIKQRVESQKVCDDSAARHAEVCKHISAAVAEKAARSMGDMIAQTARDYFVHHNKRVMQELVESVVKERVDESVKRRIEEIAAAAAAALPART